MKFKTSVLSNFKDKITQGQTDGVNIYGLYMQGAAWNIKQHLMEDSSKNVLFSEMPVIYLLPVKMDVAYKENDYMCPLYKTSFRAGELSTTGHSTNFILYMNMTSVKPEDFWVKRGVALLCQLDD